MNLPAGSETIAATSERPLRTRAKANDIREALEQQILTGERQPGSKLDEKSIADQFSVSRTPVREALMQLATAGLVELIANRGAFVRTVSTEQLIEMFEVMAELEAMAGRLASRRATAEAVGRLRELLVQCEESAAAQDVDAYYRTNEHFHQQIYRASGNSFLIEEASRLQQRLKPFRRLQLRVPQRLNQSLKEHHAIVRAIAEGRAADCASELRAHVTIQGERFSDFVAIVSKR